MIGHWGEETVGQELPIYECLAALGCLLTPTKARSKMLAELSRNRIQ